MLNGGTDEAVRSIVHRAVMRKLSAAGRNATDIDDGCKLLELGVIDSEDLVEIILEVEEQCGYEFNPEGMDFEGGVTLGTLVGSFVVRT